MFPRESGKIRTWFIKQKFWNSILQTGCIIMIPCRSMCWCSTPNTRSFGQNSFISNMTSRSSLFADMVSRPRLSWVLPHVWFTLQRNINRYPFFIIPHYRSYKLSSLSWSPPWWELVPFLRTLGHCFPTWRISLFLHESSHWRFKISNRLRSSWHRPPKHRRWFIPWSSSLGYRLWNTLKCVGNSHIKWNVKIIIIIQNDCRRTILSICTGLFVSAFMRVITGLLIISWSFRQCPGSQVHLEVHLTVLS